MANIFFSADSHYFHSNIIKYSNRPFDNVEDMNEALISNWNNKVSSQDIVYFLGDFAFAPQDKVKAILERLNGNLHLCKGNHDKPLNSLHHYFTSVFDLKTISIQDEDAIGQIQFIQMCHYPMLSWDRMHYGSIMLHGHTHGNIKFDSKFRRVDVGVDNWNYAPVSYNEIKEFLKNNYKGK